MLKKLYLLTGSIIAACTSLLGQISNFIELSDSDNPVSDVTDDMQVHLADLDDDGFEEVIMHNNDMSSMRYFDNDGAGTLTALDPTNNPLSAILLQGSLENGDNKRFEFADFDNDGDTDVAVFSQKYYNDGSVLLFENDGAQNYTEIANNLMLPSTISNGQFTDIDGDGDLDCVTSDFVYDEDTKIWTAYNQVAEFDDVTGSFGAFEDFPNLVGDQINFIDIDEDGDDDSFTGLVGEIQWQEKMMPSMFGPQSASLVLQMQDAKSAFHLDVGDLDNDGILEMILYDTTIPKMRMFQQTCADPPGTACNDGDDCTINDALDLDCNCTGEFQDSDNDGICDAEDDTNGDCTLGGACDDGDECTENDVFDADCNCAGTALPDTDMDGICDAIDDTNGDCTLGATCDDGDPCTENDVFDADCNCAGTDLPDTDMDGICDAEDDTNGDCTLGASCDDGDECTLNDAFDADCNCIGEESPDTDMDGICDAIDETNGDCSLGAPCDDGDVCTINDFFDADCNCAGTFQDGDGDGICDAEDDCDGSLTGQACNDGDDCTINDVYDENCLCAGTFEDDDNDGICNADDDTNGDCELGASCDDGDECTINDVFDADCNCAGTESGDTDMDGICDAIDDTNGDCELGGVCDDGDDCTVQDVFDADCNCAGTFEDSDMDGICDAEDETDGDCELGGACDDGDACTEEDAFDADCQCIGVFQDEDEDTVCDADDECPGLDDLLLPIVGDADMDGDIDCDDLLVSVEEILANQIAIFPNPTNGILRLETDIFVQEILVYSTMGQVIAEINNNTKQIDLQSFAQGAYFIEVRTEEGTLRKRIILQK